MMKLIGQKDFRWADVTIGKSASKIKDYGCTISSVSMLSDWYNCFSDPAWLAKNLSFQVDLILWKSITEKLCFRWTWRQYGYDENKILQSLEGKTTSCILQIQKRHWVVGIRKVGSYYLVADPWVPNRHFYHKKY